MGNSPSLIGKTVSRYRVVERLGSGGMGVVYKAEDTRLHRFVALKFLPEDLARDRRALERFEREAQAASALDHPNICTIHEIGEFEGKPFLAMQYLEGQPLRRRIGGQPLPTDVILELGVEIADGLEAAHEKGIIHRDMKPDNVFVTRRGSAKILDFGLAKLMDPKGAGGGAEVPTLDSAEATLTRPGSAVGTVVYMSPEQVRGEELDARSDLFSLGLVLYEMATGRQAFTGKTLGVIHDAILHRDPIPIGRINPEIPEQLELAINKAIEKDRKLRYQSAADLRADLLRLKRDSDSGRTRARGMAASPDASSGAGVHAAGVTLPAGTTPASGTAAATPATPATAPAAPVAKRSKLWLAAVAVAVLAAVGAGAWLYLNRTPKLTSKDTIVLADFSNTTGQSVFDGTLRQALLVQLSQSPFLNILPRAQVQQTLRLMGQPNDAAITSEIAREICERTSSAVTIDGSISMLGSQYVIGLNAADCQNGNSLAREQVTANRPEDVLTALGSAVTKLRARLGESLPSIQKFNTPLAEATTSSLPALKAFSTGETVRSQKGDAAAIPYFKQAIHLDPNFALAYTGLGIAYSNLGELSLATDYLTKAYRLRNRVTERERLDITAMYNNLASGDLDAARQAFQQWEQTFPRDFMAPLNLGNLYLQTGQFDSAVNQALVSIRLNPENPIGYTNLALAYLALGRVDDARSTLDEAHSRHFDYPILHLARYLLAFLQNDQAGMKKQAAWAVGKVGSEDLFLSSESETAAYSGRLSEARNLDQQAVATAQRDGMTEDAWLWNLDAALQEAELGDPARARQIANQLLKTPGIDRYTEAVAALALARAGDAAGAQPVVASLAKQFPSDTMINAYWLPTLRAAIALDRGDAAQALQALQPAAQYQMGLVNPFIYCSTLYPVYLRGLALLEEKQGQQAAAAFQFILSHRGAVLNFPIGALAQLDLARAQALEGNSNAARTSYQNFFALWQHADPDLPSLKQARAEYAKLQ